MSSPSPKIKVNFILSHKSEIYITDSTPNGERRLFDEEFWNALEEKVLPNFIHLYKPFNAKSGLARNVANVLYHFKNYFTVKKRADPNAISHIFFGEEASVLRFLPLKKSVVTCLDIIPIAFPQGLKWHYRIFYKMCVKGLKKAARILAVSENTKRDLVKYLRIEPAKIKTAYWGINKIFRPNQATAGFRKKYGLDPSKKYIVSVGALDSPRKNLGLLIKIMPRILSRIPDAELIITGYKNDTTGSPLQNFIDRENLQKRIHLLTKIPDEDLCSLYNVAAVFVFPSLYEGFGLPPVEAMACGAPVIASSNSSLPEAVGAAGILVDSVAGFAADPATNPANESEFAENIIKVLGDENLRRDMIEKGFLHAKKFTWKAYADSLYETYLELNNEPNYGKN